MKIHYVSCIESNKGWGSDGFFSQAFRDLGHEVIDTDHRRTQDLGSVLKSIECDLVIVQRGGPHVTKEILDQAPTKAKVLIYSELAERHADDVATFPAYDLVTVRQRSCIDTFRRMGVHKSIESRVFSPNAFAPSLHRPLPQSLNEPKRYDLLFVGTLSDRRVGILQELGRFFKLGVGKAFGAQYTEAINSTKVALNLHFTGYLDSEQRIAEILGCHVPVVTELLPVDSEFVKCKNVFESSGGIEDLATQVETVLQGNFQHETSSLWNADEKLDWLTYQRKAFDLLQLVKTVTGVG